ncbi:nucleotide-binding protein, putative [Entamoeba invadens IP1]|uniref:Nucleotide-binding protein, putative n=1 Tax=Entamoeba invadens TaxID=33085 RepID=S0B2D2_ENTIV|nr:nucleotide-binding protein, putative [Entamoeba invadens IP1]ELP93996.1 nucleotide-binding protein, putative [Entamoeba invadens IP1]BAN41349.1 nucleotide-binding protein, putative [Entamoeba invadens]|eukprot:XP_004260767.1 nucleotide-binding protein, putative [Entamoeba invadens IP1]
MTEFKPDTAYCGVSHIKNIILVLSGKGGVGKSTVASSLARAFAQAGMKTGILDIDLCGPSIPKMFGVSGSGVFNGTHGGIAPVKVDVSGHNLDVLSIGFMLSNPDAPVIWRGPKKSGAIQQFLQDVEWGEKDVLIIDTPPGTSDEHMTIMQLIKESNKKTQAVLVTTPQIVSVNDVEKEIDFCKMSDVEVLGVIENMSGYLCPHCQTTTNIFSSQGGKTLAEKYNFKFIGTIPIEPKVCMSGETGTNPFSDQPSATALKALTSFVEEFIKTA